MATLYVPPARCIAIEGTWGNHVRKLVPLQSRHVDGGSATEITCVKTAGEVLRSLRGKCGNHTIQAVRRRRMSSRGRASHWGNVVEIVVLVVIVALAIRFFVMRK
jgi:hypothetical protein